MSGVGLLGAKEALPEDTAQTIRTRALAGEGSVAIAADLRLPDGRALPPGRVRSFLRSAGLGTAAQRAAGGVDLLGAKEALPEETAQTIRTRALAGEGYVAIAADLRLPDGRALPPTRVRSFLQSAGLGTAAQRAANHEAA